MCGIIGLTGPGASLWIEDMTQTLEHRGPDTWGTFSDHRVSLGHRRLAILDLSDDGRQPMIQGSVHVVFNGEIYNFRELRTELTALGARFRTKTDTEVLIHGYKAWGKALFSRLNGMFALAIYDSARKKIVLARDRSGQKPLYYALFKDQSGRERLAFASELRALSACPSIPKSLNLRSLTKFLSYDYVPVPQSILAGIQKLPGGSFADFDLGSGTFQIKKYWKPHYEERSLSLDQAAKELRERLLLSLERRLQSDVPLGVFLSGGIDSSTLVALLKQDLGIRDLATFSIGFDDASFDESKHAQLIAETFGTEHHLQVFNEKDMTDLVPRVFDHIDEPFADPSILPTYMLCELTRKHVTVALGGDGGDELFAGYDPFRAWAPAQFLSSFMPGMASKRLLSKAVSFMPVSEKNMSFEFRVKRLMRGLSKPPPYRHSAWLSPFEPEMLRNLLSDGAHAQLKQSWGADVLSQESLWDESLDAWREGGTTTSTLNRQINYYFRCYLGEGILTKVDRASMAHSLELRAPFLDPELIDWAATLPDSMKLSGSQGKVVLRHMVRDQLPRSIMARPKKGFGIPVSRWLRGPLRDWIEDLLSEASLKSLGLFRYKTVRRLLDEHMSKKIDRRKELWALATFMAWHRRFF
ncbi:MAG: asparagine synthase (glutamine-hydrolyzing) [Planctomycetota bacterium]|nr:asparagine synthase (glutamine-hydrolyzing) [Planctomycetota bacterium]